MPSQNHSEDFHAALNGRIYQKEKILQKEVGKVLEKRGDCWAGERERENEKEREREREERKREVKYIKRHDLLFNVHPLSYNKTAICQLYRNLITHIVHYSAPFIPAVLSRGRQGGVCHQDFLEVSRSFQFRVGFFLASFNL